MEKNLIEIADAMNSQDCEGVSFPIFAVYDVEQVIDGDGEIVKYFNDDFEEVSVETELAMHEDVDLDDVYDVSENMSELGYRRETYSERPVFTGKLFLTRQEAENFVSTFAHLFERPSVEIISCSDSDNLSAVLGFISKMGANPNSEAYSVA